MDLKITQAWLPGRSHPCDIAIDKGTIIEIAPAISGTATTMLEAQGKLVIPGLVDAHIHLDKAFLLDRVDWQTGTFTEALQETANAKRSFTIADIQTRARRVLEQAIAFGTTAMRSHVEVDPLIQLTGIKALLPLRDKYAWGITLQLAIFAQEGITNQPGTEALLRQAMTLGGDVIGSAPYVDPEPEQNICIVFDIAQAFNCDVDFHLDFLDDDAPLLLPLVIAETLKRGWRGRVCLGHMTKLAGLPPGELEAIATATATAGISILALPATDLYMMSRRDTHNVRRGVAPAQTLAAWGVNTGVATNNVQNLFTPFGDGDLLKICTLLAQVLHLNTAASHEACLAMATTQAAQAIGLSKHGLVPGNDADLVILEAASVTEAIGAAPSNRTVIKKGRIVAQSQLHQTRFPT
ncbi:amidohydrolase family protein [Stenomitos frigidus]|uniref:Amidohydrolase n=1 Tax=Stenomitos frigidus ULC18 TaxID=2107698 RepID=A0A2T1E989_9CYAN|nr:amidohydrolase family protein [Stenomitos frigidus]PSB29283.1 amidohydrolase [Stenomitos frigidus ULC18]